LRLRCSPYDSTAPLLGATSGRSQRPSDVAGYCGRPKGGKFFDCRQSSWRWLMRPPLGQPVL